MPQPDPFRASDRGIMFMFRFLHRETLCHVSPKRHNTPTGPFSITHPAS